MSEKRPCVMDDENGWRLARVWLKVWLKVWSRVWLAWVPGLILGACASLEPALEGQRTLGNLIIQGVPDIPQALVERMQQYRNTRSARLLGWLPEGLLIATRFAQTGQVHRVRAPLAVREQVTFFSEPVTRAYVPPSPDVDGFVYARDIGGSEFYQLFWFDWQTGQSRLLTDGKSRYTGVLWANGADRFAYTTTERDGRRWDIHIQDLHGNRSVALETDTGAWEAIDWAPDDDRLLVDQYLSINESYLYELDLATGTLTPLLDETIKTSIGTARYDGDGKGVYFTSDLGAEFMRLHYLDLETGKIDVLTGGIPWNVEEITVSGDGEYLALTVNEGGFSRLSVWQLPHHTPLALSELPRGMIFSLQFSPDGRQLGFGLNSPTAPADIYSLDLVERTTTRWTRSEVGGLDPGGFVEPELVGYPTFDTVDGRPREIPAFVYRPRGEGPHPVLINIHGGPESQIRPYFSATVQYFVNELGIAVIAPNVRGSNGYGKSYLKLDNGYLREDSVKDIGSLLDWIAEDPDLDAERVG
ncbi:MAG: prolyl oligopeptidase family serine peptidase, partial [Gammaproteobacteria bacterium]|nr:prolyl oligopeptidase family serine peptidase [Gammaproteobacteria bacterium]